MVSNTIGVSEEELLRTLARIRERHADDPDYREWRKNFPKSWPL